MQKNKQLVSSKESGDCHRACVTSILEIPNDPELLPDASAKHWYVLYHKFLRQFGLEMVYDELSFWRSGYWIASVPSLNYPDTWHSIVMKGSDVAFDPSTKKRYEAGTSMSGKNLIKGGFWLELVDASKIHKLQEFKDKLPAKKSKEVCWCGDYKHQHKGSAGVMCFCGCKEWRYSHTEK